MSNGLTLLLCATTAVAAAPQSPIRTAAELKRVLYDEPQADRPFALSVEVRHVRESAPQSIAWAIHDDSGDVIVTTPHRMLPKEIAVGDRAKLEGRTIVGKYGIVCPLPTNVVFTGHGSAPQPIDINAADFLSGRYDCRLVRLSGLVKDAFFTEDNPHWAILVLVSDGEVLNVSLPHGGRNHTYFNGLVGATVSIDGVVVPSDNSPRRQLGRILTAAGPDDVRVLAPPSESGVIPSVDDIRGLRPVEIAALGRHRATGRVLARWQGDSILLETERGNLHEIELSEGPPPAVGEAVEAVGFPESDLYRINLTRAKVRTVPLPPRPDEPPADLHPSDLTEIVDGRTLYNPQAFGRLIRFAGVIRSLPRESDKDALVLVDAADAQLPVDVSANRSVLGRLALGCRVDVTGRVILETENWRPNAVFPRIRSVRIVLRTPDDLVVTSRPSWFTPVRLLALLGGLGSLTLLVLVWNFFLRRQSEQRGRTLAAEAIAHAESAFKVEERTRLAVELHDSVAQSLTGVAMELEAAQQYEGGARPEMLQHLRTAWNTLKSCRGELRNCLWDLRSRALEAADMNETIRRTLLPSVKGVALQIRFNVPRDRFTDNTAHTVLRIIRELVINGIRHGGATEIHIAGAEENDSILFSVRDNGSGFDPDLAPGVLQGHFGLEGIRERVRTLGGTLTIESASGRGTKATVRLHAGNDTNRESPS